MFTTGLLLCNQYLLCWLPTSKMLNYGNICVVWSVTGRVISLYGQHDIVLANSKLLSQYKCHGEAQALQHHLDCDASSANLELFSIVLHSFVILSNGIHAFCCGNHAYCSCASYFCIHAYRACGYVLQYIPDIMLVMPRCFNYWHAPFFHHA